MPNFAERSASSATMSSQLQHWMQKMQGSRCLRSGTDTTSDQDPGCAKVSLKGSSMGRCEELPRCLQLRGKAPVQQRRGFPEADVLSVSRTFWNKFEDIFPGPR